MAELFDHDGYRVARAAAGRRRVRALFPWLVIGWCLAGWFDLTAPREVAGPSLIARFGVGAPAFLAATLFAWQVTPARFIRWWQTVLATTYGALLACSIAFTVLASAPLVPHAVIGFLIVLVAGGALGLLAPVPLVVVSALACVAELLVLALDPEARGLGVQSLATWVIGSELAMILLAFQLEVLQRRLHAGDVELERARGRIDRLVRTVLPAVIADRLAEGARPIADQLDDVTVVFADIHGFTPIAALMTPAELVGRLDGVFARIDAIMRRHGLEPIKTIGDGYMAVAGAPTPRADHAEAAARAALAITALSREVGLGFRVGLASGPAVAGVIGRSRLAYDLWGDTVNLASHMESQGVPGRVQVDDDTRRVLDRGFVFEERGTIEVKGRGAVKTFFLIAEAGEAAEVAEAGEPDEPDEPDEPEPAG